MLTPNISMGGDPRAQFTTQFGDSAVLYLFSKRYMPDQYRRSFVYNFNERVTNEIAEKVERVGTVGGISPGACYLRGVTEAAEAIKPEAVGQHLNTAIFREQWTFLLIVDRNGLGAPFEQAGGGPVNFRDIYSGWVIDEPVSTNISNFNTGYSFNPGALFNVTHQTRLSSTSMLMSTGMCNSTSVLSNMDFINGQTAQAINDNGTTVFDLRPERVTAGINVEGGGDGSRVFAGAAVANTHKSIAVECGLNNPTQHMQRIVNGLCDTSRLFRTTTGDLGFIADTNGVASTLSGQLSCGDGRMGIVNGGIDPTIPFTFDKLDKMYPGLKVTVVRQESGPTVDYINAGAATPQNVMNSMISSALPDIMINNGLGDVAFTYCSWMNPPMGSNLPGERGTFEFQDVGPLYQSDPSVIASHCDNFRRALFMDLFPLILGSCGDFYLMVRSSISGETIINLNLLDYGSMNQKGYYEQSNRFGGLNTSMIGAQNTFENNANQFVNTIQQVLHTASVPSGTFDYPMEYR